jgi:hypothetical protein
LDLYRDKDDNDDLNLGSDEARTISFGSVQKNAVMFS